MAGQTPMMRQWAELKRSVPGGIVLFRLGDFYEAFNEDAEVLARVCDVTLTSRPVAKGARAPMAGVPYHAVDGYIAQLVRAGVKVAIVEQQGAESSPEKRARMSGPPREGASSAPSAPARGGKTILAREIVRVVTPGTLIEGDLIDAGAGHYLAAMAPSVGGGSVGLAVLDLSTGEFMATELAGPEPERALVDELARFRPAELIVPASWPDEARAGLGERLELLGLATTLTAAPAWPFDHDNARRTLLEHFRTQTLAGFGLADGSPATAAAGAALAYASENQRARLDQVKALTTWQPGAAMVMDAVTRRNLELTVTLRGEKRGTLLSVIDRTRTAPGARRLRAWLDQPLLDNERLAARHDAVEALLARPIDRAALRDVLGGIPDIERLVNRVVTGYAGPRDLAALARGLAAIPRLGEQLAAGAWPALLAGRCAQAECAVLAARVAMTLADEPPAVAGVPGVVRDGFDAELDAIHASVAEARDWIAALEARERERTGIRRLKVGYNKVFGYYVQIPKASAAEVPEDWVRRQTVVDGERYVSPALKEREAEVLDAEERIIARERALLDALRAAIADEVAAIRAAAADVARVDALAALAEVAADHGYVRPELTAEPVLDITGGRHPVVERRPGARFVPNDLALGIGEIILLTGPNMAGKSTVGRQAALIVLLAQIGSFVPAARARVGLADRIFTRIGAQDELAAGQSTFMVEMVETANILHHATPRSLVILDELGRGTSTYDGIAIAWAVIEHLAAMAPHAPRTLFATHYHELTALADTLPRVTNRHLAVADEGGRIAFLHTVAPGPADRSYGVHVAELAGLPGAVTKRAWTILRALEAEGGAPMQVAADRPEVEDGDGQLSLFVPPPPAAPHPVISELASMDVDGLTPRSALDLLYQLAARARGGAEGER